MSLIETIDNEIQILVPQMIEDVVMAQTHNGGDGVRILGSDLANAPQSAVTAATGTALTTGGTAVLSTSDSTILANAIIRIAELESRLQSLGLLN